MYMLGYDFQFFLKSFDSLFTIKIKNRTVYPIHAKVVATMDVYVLTF